MAVIRVARCSYFEGVESVYRCDTNAWEIALDLMASAVARGLAQSIPEPGPASQPTGWDDRSLARQEDSQP